MDIDTAVPITAATESEVSTRKYVGYALLSAMLPGLGQLVKGHTFKAAVLLTTCAVYVSIQWIFRTPFSYTGLLVSSLVAVVLFGFSSVDAFATRILRHTPRPRLSFLLLVIPVAFVACQFEIWALWRAQGVRPFKVPSTSMEPTIALNESIVTDAGYYRDRVPGRGDVIVFRHGGLFIVKRVIAVSGDSIEGTPESIILNGHALPLSLESSNPAFQFSRMTIPPGKLFVAGDNRAVSLDSRVSGYGLVDVKDVVSKAIYISRSKTSERIGAEIR